MRCATMMRRDILLIYLNQKSIQEGQFPKCCELCESDIQIKWKCINCKLFICTKCKDKVHSKFQYADKHKIIGIEEVGKHTEELDFSNIYCKGHEGQTCVMSCKSCDKLVCPRCIFQHHKGHELVEISEAYQIKVDILKEELIKQQKNIDELINVESQIKLLRKAEHAKYTKTKDQIHAQNVSIKKSVDKSTNKLIKELDQKWETLQNTIDAKELEVTALWRSKENQNTKVEGIISSNDVDKVFKHTKITENTTNEYTEPLKLEFTPMPKFIPEEIIEYNVGSLHNVSNDVIIQVLQQFKTDTDSVFNLLSCPDNSLWISDPNVIQRVKPEGSNLKVMTNFNMKIYDMALTPSNDLLLVTNESKLIQISGSSGQITDSVYNADPLHFTKVHVTSDYKVMVGAMTAGPSFPGTERRVLIRMNKEGKHEKTYEHNRDKQPIFTYIRHITTTTNSTIFVVDRLSEDSRGRLVVLGQDGDVLNTYTGHPRINSNDKPFKPVYAVTTPLDNIIVSELGKHTLHILNSVGHLITYYNIKNIGILWPYSLTFSTSGQMYIGCTKLVGNKDKGKLYKVYISQI